MQRKPKVKHLILCLMLIFTLIIAPCLKAFAGGKEVYTQMNNYYQGTLRISNQYLGIDIDRELGYFNSGCNIEGNKYDISYQWPNYQGTSYSTIKIDNVNYGICEDLGSNFVMTTPPTNISDLENVTVWNIGSIEVKQTLKIVDNPLTGRCDTGMYKYTIKNKDSVSHSVGLRIMIDTCLNRNDGNPFNIPGIGSIVNEIDFTGSSIPQYWQGFEDIGSSIMAQGILYSSGVTKPDRFALCEWGYVVDYLWDYTINTNHIIYDSAVAMWWNPVTLGAGETKEFSTLYGLGTMSGTADLSITGPVVLDVVNNEWNPNPFTIMVYAANNTNTTLTDVDLTLNLPEGLSLPNGESASKTIPLINPGNVVQVSWDVAADKSGTFNYSVFSSELNASASRTITVPYIDKTAPITFISTESKPNSNGWLNKDIKITLIASDEANGSGVKEVHYKIGNNEEVVQGDSAVFNITNGGETIVKYWAVDNSGNKEEEKTAIVKIDKVKPVITINSPENKLYDGNTTLDFTATDELSGIDTISALLDNKPVNNGDVIDASLLTAGKHTLTVTAKDKADNISTSSVEFEIKDIEAIEVSEVKLNKNEITIYVGDKFDLIATVLPENASDKSVTWSSSAQGKAAVDQNGKVTGVHAGEAIITVTTKDGKHSAECKVIVKNKEGTLPVTGTNIYYLIPIGILSILFGSFLLLKKKIFRA